MENAEKIINEIRKIAEIKQPKSLDDDIKDLWIAGFIAGYLERVIGELNQNSKSKNHGN